MYSIILSAVFYYLAYRVFKYLFDLIGSLSFSEKHNPARYFSMELPIAFLVYSSMALLFFYPCLKQITSSLIGPPEDNMQILWNSWLASKYFSGSGDGLLFTRYIFFPEGADLTFHTLSFYNLALSVLLAKLTNIVFAYNLLVLLTFVLSGVSAYVLLRFLGINNFFSLIGGFIYAFNPFHFAQSLHHLNIASIQFMPIFILFFIKMVKEDKIKYLFLCWLFLALNTLCSWHYFVYCGYFMFFAYIYLAIRNKKIFLAGVVKKIAIVLCATLLLFLPLLMRMIQLGSGYSLSKDWYYHNNMAADLLGLIFPHPYHALSNLEAVRFINGLFTGNDWIKSVYLGIVNITLVVFGFMLIKRKIAKYALGMFLFILMAMGTKIRILGVDTGIFLPGSLIKYIPFLSNARCPARFVVFVYLFLAIIVAYLLMNFYNLYARSVKMKFALFAMLGLIFLDYYSVCRLATPVKLPDCYKLIRDSQENFGILDIPGLSYPDWWINNEYYMMYQTMHGKPIVQGAISRKIGTTLIDWVERDDLSTQHTQLIHNKVKYIVIHKDFLRGVKKIDIGGYLKQYKLVYEDEKAVLLNVY